jgi:hypothetical protein
MHTSIQIRIHPHTHRGETLGVGVSILLQESERSSELFKEAFSTLLKSDSIAIAIVRPYPFSLSDLTLANG